MKKQNSLHIYKISLAFLLMSVFLVVASLLRATESRHSVPPGLEKATELLQLEHQYFKDRFESKWKAIYNRQHPTFRKKVSLELFINRYGLAGYDTPELLESRKAGPLSILPVPSDLVTTPRDGLGMPTVRKYRMFGNPWVKVDDYQVEQVSMDPDGLYAKVDVTLNITETLPPSLFRVNAVLPHSRAHTDYWEKIDGHWVVALMVHSASISGSRDPVFFSPNEMDQMKEIDWIVFDSQDLEDKGGKDE